MEADFADAPILDEIRDAFMLDQHEISSDFNFDQMEEEAREVEEVFSGKRKVTYDCCKTFCVCFRWVANGALIGLPWLFISYTGVMWNIVCNVVMNHWWAGGNFWLVGNSIFALVQTIHTWFLVFEWPFYLRHTYALRWAISLLSIIYSLWIFSDGMAVIGMDKWETDETYQNYDLADMITDMFLAYNVIMHWPIALTGIVIITKEIEMNIFQMVTTNGPADYQLSWQNAQW